MGGGGIEGHKNCEQKLCEQIGVFYINQGGPGSVRLRFGGGAVQAVPVFGSGSSSAIKGFSVVQSSLTRKDGSGSGFGSWKTVPAVPVPLSVSGKTVPTVPVSYVFFLPLLFCQRSPAF